MKVMVVWKTVPGKYKTALEAFLCGGGPVPAGARPWGVGTRRVQSSAGISSRQAT